MLFMHPRTLTRSQFDDACKALVAKYAFVEPTVKGLKGWSWKEHPSVARLGYLSRTVWISRRGGARKAMVTEEVNLLESAAETAETPGDDAVWTSQDQTIHALNCCQYIVYSASFQVPAFYFTVHDLNGSPLTLDEILQTSLFKPSAFESTEITPYCVSLPSASFPLLSHGDHPTTGLPCWYFHPCKTSSAVEELMSEVKDATYTGETVPLRWLEVWSMVVGTMVDWVE